MPAIELHGNLSQNARTRNLAAFSTGTATTLVATDIAARGIHVDDVGLVVHADPPVEHKAYLHRSGRTARAGNEGTVVTLMLDSQVSDVRDLTRKAGIRPTITRLGTGHPLLEQIAPGERTFVAASAMPERAANDEAGRGGRNGGGRNGGGRNGVATAAQAGTRGVVVAGATPRPRRSPPAATATAVAVAAPAPRPRRHPVAVRTAPRRSPPTAGADPSRIVRHVWHRSASQAGAKRDGLSVRRRLLELADLPSPDSPGQSAPPAGEIRCLLAGTTRMRGRLLQLGRGQTQEPAGDDQLLDLLGALEDVEDLGVAGPLLQQLVLAVADAAGQLDAAAA